MTVIATGAELALPQLHDREGWKAFIKKNDWQSIQSGELCVAFRAIDNAHSKLAEYALYTQLSLRIRSVAWRYVNGGMINYGRDVVEAVGSLLLPALRQQDNLDGISLCHAFGFVVHHRTIDCIRRERAQRRLFAPLSTDALGEVTDTSSPTPATLDQLLDIQGALDSIPDPGQRRVVELRLQEYKIPEIAAELGIGVDAAVYRLNVGIGAVINHLAGEPR